MEVCPPPLRWGDLLLLWASPRTTRSRAPRGNPNNSGVGIYPKGYSCPTPRGLTRFPWNRPLTHGSHGHWKTWKTWKMTNKNSRYGKIMEFEKKGKYHGKIMEFKKKRKIMEKSGNFIRMEKCMTPENNCA